MMPQTQNPFGGLPMGRQAALPNSLTPTAASPDLGYGNAANPAWMGIMARLQTDPQYLEQEMARARQVAANRMMAGLDTSAQDEYYQMLLNIKSPQSQGRDTVGARPSPTSPILNPGREPVRWSAPATPADLERFAGQKIGPPPVPTYQSTPQPPPGYLHIHPSQYEPDYYKTGNQQNRGPR